MRSAHEHKKAAEGHQAAMNRVSALRVKLQKASTKVQNAGIKQQEHEQVRAARAKDEQRLQEVADKKERDLQAKQQVHTKMMEETAGETEAAVAAVIHRNANLGAAGRARQQEADQLLENRSQAIAHYNIEQANYVRESTKQGISQSMEMRRQQVTGSAAELKQNSEANSEKAFKLKEGYQADKARKVQAVQATHEGVRNAALKLKQRNDALGAEERQRTAEEEAQIAAFGEHMTQYKCDQFQHVKHQSQMVAERQRQVAEEKRKQAETDRGLLAQTLETNGAQQAAQHLAVAQKTAALKESLEAKSRSAVEQMAMQKRKQVQKDLEDRDAQAQNFVGAAGQSAAQLLAEEQYLLDQLASLQ